MNNVIEIENLYKEYRLGTFGYGTLQEDIQSWWAKLRGRPDPNSLIESNIRTKNHFYQDNHILALDNINIQVKRGDRLGIIGKNGAGKTTLLKILSRISSPSSGEVRIKGKVASLLAVGAGFHQELSGRENIYLNGAILGLNKKQITKRLDAIVEFSGVEKFIDTPVKRYSSGMYVRLGFAVAAYLEPDILIVDEVLAVGDHEFQRKCIEKMEDSSKQGRTVIFVSHNMHSVRKLCHNAILLENGKNIANGPVNDVISQYLKDINSEKPIIELPAQNNTSVYTRKLITTDKNKNLTNNIFLNDFFNVRIEFKVNQMLPNLIVTIGLITNTQIPIITYWSEPSDLNPGDYFVDCIIDLNLAACELSFAIGYTSRGKLENYQENIGKLRLLEISKSKQPYKVSGGILLNNHRPIIKKIS